VYFSFHEVGFSLCFSYTFSVVQQSMAPTIPQNLKEHREYILSWSLLSKHVLLYVPRCIRMNILSSRTAT